MEQLCLADQDCRLINLQFSFSNRTAVPEMVPKRSSETQAQSVVRKSHHGGVMVVDPTMNCSLEQLSDDLEKAGYLAVDAFYKPRINPKNRRKMYHMVRFVFAHREFATPSDAFVQMRGQVLEGLRSICESAYWRVRVFSNPFYEGGEQVPGTRALSVNLEGRRPLRQADGRPVTQWLKDVDGRRVGDAPAPLKQDYDLRLFADRQALTSLPRSA